jgi:hypothetical protein
MRESRLSGSHSFSTSGNSFVDLDSSCTCPRFRIDLNADQTSFVNEMRHTEDPMLQIASAAVAVIAFAFVLTSGIGPAPNAS